jgi:hypothetical protein
MTEGYTFFVGVSLSQSVSLQEENIKLFRINPTDWFIETASQ